MHLISANLLWYLFQRKQYIECISRLRIICSPLSGNISNKCGRELILLQWSYCFKVSDNNSVLSYDLNTQASSILSIATKYMAWIYQFDIYWFFQTISIPFIPQIMSYLFQTWKIRENWQSIQPQLMLYFYIKCI